LIDQTLPLIDLHRHLDGSIRLETVLDLGRKHNIPLPAWNIDEIRPFIQVTVPKPEVMAFIAMFKWTVSILVDYEACQRVAYENVEDAYQEGIDYIELRFSPWFMSEPNHLEPAGVVSAVIEGVTQAARDTGIKVNLIGVLSRTYGPESAMEELEALLTHSASLVALDLAGDEVNYPADLFIKHFKKAWDVGWQVTVHAGESAGPESIWSAIRNLKATRIGHAVHSREDPVLLDYMRDHHIGIETSLTSNLQTSTVPDYASHPLRSFLEKGLLATINTDDPGISGITLPYEYNVAAPAAGLSSDQIRIAQRNALDLAFLSSEEKKELLLKKSVR